MLSSFFHIFSSSSGTFSIFVKTDSTEKLVGCYDNRGSFGELALMYNTPRAATIIATSPGAVWCLASKPEIFSAAVGSRLFLLLQTSVRVIYHWHQPCQRHVASWASILGLIGPRCVQGAQLGHLRTHTGSFLACRLKSAGEGLRCDEQERVAVPVCEHFKDQPSSRWMAAWLSWNVGCSSLWSRCHYEGLVL